MRKSFVVFLAACASIAFAQGPPPGGGPGRGMPPAKNLKVLTQDTYLGVMFSIPTALGVRCDFCHTEDRASDEKPEKVTARKMMEMVKNINANTFNGEQKVACWTCHRGQAKPEAPPAGRGPGGFGRGPGGPGPGGPGAPPPGAPPAQ